MQPIKTGVLYLCFGALLIWIGILGWLGAATICPYASFGVVCGVFALSGIVFIVVGLITIDNE